METEEQQNKRKLLMYITESVNDLPARDKITILEIISNDLGIDNVIESSDGCRVIIDTLSKSALNDILKVYAPYICDN